MMKRILAVMALVCLMSISTLAGDIPTMGIAAPVSNGATETTKPGDIPTLGKLGDMPIGGKVAEISSDALSALLSALSFLV